ncbi:MAG: hypothetical protein PUH85_00575 [Firmicutes bacterium]|nr:hypothetical protein [Erysipelotrichaceae bacterium]MDD7226878.1 hypothetical protein [Bacillota bacterium]MDY5998456.1 hypothetical protein [Erysipelotrichaceae bacterium]
MKKYKPLISIISFIITVYLSKILCNYLLSINNVVLDSSIDKIFNSFYLYLLLDFSFVMILWFLMKKPNIDLKKDLTLAIIILVILFILGMFVNPVCLIVCMMVLPFIVSILIYYEIS